MNERVTLKDVYDVVNRLQDKIEGRVAGIEKDVDELKSFHQKLIGMATLAAGFVSLLTTFIWNRVMGDS